MTAATAPTAGLDRPEVVWRTLAPLLNASGRRSVRVYEAETGRFSGVARLTASLPARPAATYLYTKGGRTQLLALDFDCSRGGRAAVEADLASAAEWITRCGGVVVSDRSPGGAHLLCPLAIGTTAGVEEISHLVALLAARLPTLDKSPNTNAATGCLSAPGSPAKQGGYRQLVGSLSDAVDAFTTRSHPALLPRLYELVGAVRSAAPAPAAGTPCVAPADYCTGDGDERRLAPVWVRDDPFDPDILQYAQHGILPSQRHWDTASEARMAVITAAIARGHSPHSIAALALAPGGPWHAGLGASYLRHCRSSNAAATAMRRDFEKSLTWLCSTVLKHRSRQHKKKYSRGGKGGGVGPCGPHDLRRWLAAAMLWADGVYHGRRRRWTVHSVLQTLAWNAYNAGTQHNGTWTVGVGGRNLSLGTALLSPDAVFSVLRELREFDGAPLLHTVHHAGVNPDQYALTWPAGITVNAAAVARTRIEPIHDAWSVVGEHLRRIYELVAYHGITTRAELYAAAAMSPGVGDEAVTTLQIAGLLTRPSRGVVAAGSVSLDAIAAAHDTDAARQKRITHYQAERQQWRTWLVGNVADHVAASAQAAALNAPAVDPDAERAFWTSAMIHGPPDDDAHPCTDDDTQALHVVLATLGGRIIPTPAA